ncbi:MAG: hypothetical protein ACLQGP_31595 [Isosphaeraceae bacterium]
MDRPSGIGPVQKGTSAMLWRHLCLARACSAAGLVSATLFLGGSISTAQTPTAVPVRSEPSAPPVEVATETVDLLKASKSGDLSVVAHGQGQDRVRMTIQNTTNRRLNVIIPPGMIAASKTAQGGGAGGGRGMQSIGLGSVTNREGAFGEFQGEAGIGGLRSVQPTFDATTHSVGVPAKETVDVSVPGVCLNYGLPAPTGRDTLTLVDVDSYTTDPRIRKALRSLATLGTSHGVAQAVMWRICNDLPFEQMIEQSAGKTMNVHEIALAARFVEALEECKGADLVERSALTESRIFVQLEGVGALGRDARRLQGQLEGLHVMGMPLKVVETEAIPASSAPAMALKVILTESKTGETRGRIVVSACSEPNAWTAFGKVAFRENSSISVLDGPTLARSIDRTMAGAFVSVKPARRSVGSTTLNLENRLPFTISNVVVRAGNSSGAPSVPFQGVGVGPARSAHLPIQAATASLVEHVELNGL